MLHVSGDGDFIPMQMLFSQDSTDVVYHFAVEIAAGANAGIALAPDPFGTPPADDRVQFILSTEADGGVHTRRRIDDVIIVDQLDHAGQILPDVLYDVTLTVTTEGGVTTVAHDITGLGSGSAEMAAIDSGYQSVLWARGSWGSGANASFDYITVSEVPEPATMSLLALGGVALLRRRRK